MDGLINVLKPAQVSSNHYMQRVKRLLKVKCGHGGTLDPMASGVLPILTGRATRLLDYLPPVKEYVARITFGYETDTLDADGMVITQGGRIPAPEQVRAVLKEFWGTVTQVPPMYSALKRNGVPLYKLARKGETVDIPTREVEIYETEYLEQAAEDTHIFRVKCSKGTYIRSLCRDMAYVLDTAATMTALTRTQSGFFRIEEACTAEEIEARAAEGDFSFILSPEQAVSHLPKLILPDDLLMKAVNGMKLEVEPERVEAAALYCRDHFLGLVRVEDHLSIPRALLVSSEDFK